MDNMNFSVIIWIKKLNKIKIKKALIISVSKYSHENQIFGFSLNSRMVFNSILHCFKFSYDNFTLLNIDDVPLIKTQNQPSRGVLRKRFSENIQQICWITPMPKFNFNKAAKQLYWNHTLACVFSCKFAIYFQNTFLENASGRLLLKTFV